MSELDFSEGQNEWNCTESRLDYKFPWEKSQISIIAALWNQIFTEALEL